MTKKILIEMSMSDEAYADLRNSLSEAGLSIEIRDTLCALMDSYEISYHGVSSKIPKV